MRHTNIDLTHFQEKLICHEDASISQFKECSC